MGVTLYCHGATIRRFSLGIGLPSVSLCVGLEARWTASGVVSGILVHALGYDADEGPQSAKHGGRRVFP